MMHVHECKVRVNWWNCCPLLVCVHSLSRLFWYDGSPCVSCVHECTCGITKVNVYPMTTCCESESNQYACNDIILLCGGCMLWLWSEWRGEVGVWLKNMCPSHLLCFPSAFLWLCFSICTFILSYMYCDDTSTPNIMILNSVPPSMYFYVRIKKIFQIKTSACVYNFHTSPWYIYSLLVQIVLEIGHIIAMGHLP